MRTYTLSESQFNLYAVDLHNQLYHSWFRTREAINGTEILKYSAHAQINRFVLFQLYQDWQNVSSKLQHPYFDFKAAPVVEALEHLQNVLSQHIHIKKADFKSLSERAVYNTLRLLTNPEETLVNFFFQSHSNQPITLFERYAPYFVDYGFLIQAVLSYAKREKLANIDRETFLRISERAVQLFEQQQNASFDDYRKRIFLQLTGVDLDMVANKQAASKAGLEAKEEPITLETGTKKKAKETPIKVTVIPDEEVDELPLARPATIATAHPEQERLADAFTPQVTVAKGLLTLNIDQIPLHKQFQFTQKIFGGNSNLFKDTLESVNAMNKPEQLEHYLKTRLLNMPEVRKDDKVTQEFLQLLASRFER